MATFITNQISLKIFGSVPSKKNSKKLFFVKSKKTGKQRPVFASSTNYEKWHKDAIRQIVGCSAYPILRCQRVTLTFYSQDKRAFDLTNKAESIMDLFVDCGVIKDDNYNVIPVLELRYGGLDKENPRCEAVLEFQI